MPTAETIYCHLCAYERKTSPTGGRAWEYVSRLLLTCTDTLLHCMRAVYARHCTYVAVSRTQRELLHMLPVSDRVPMRLLANPVPCV